MTMADEQEKLAALKMRADKLGHQIEPSVKKLGYCLWQSWPGVGRYMVLGRNDNDGVTLDAIAQKLDEIEAGDHAALAPQGCGPDLEVVNHHALARPRKLRRRRQRLPQSSPRRVEWHKPLSGAIDERLMGEAEMAQLYGNKSYA
jgi:hypothetical protein